MARDPFAEQSAKLLAALDFSAEAAAQEARHRQELTAIFHSLLEVMDAFDRLRDDEGDVPRRTVELLARQLARCLETAGVVALPCLGEAADPHVHEIAGVRQAEEAERDTIVEVVSGGYLWNGEPLRRPRVIVAASGKEKKS
jgi:molecular chaperone GrpE (heat shock protein)